MENNRNYKKIPEIEAETEFPDNLVKFIDHIKNNKAESEKILKSEFINKLKQYILSEEYSLTEQLILKDNDKLRGAIEFSRHIRSLFKEMEIELRIIR